MTTTKRRTEHVPQRAARIRRAFTLVEVLVALAVMMLLLTIILVPVNMALDVFHIGKARNEVQQANRLVLNQIVSDLKRAIFVYPNEAMPGITDQPPYSTDPSTAKNPYYAAGSTGTRYANVSRIDMVLSALDSSGSAVTPLRASNYIVTYYARRLTLDDSVAYDNYSNPVVLYRAQYPITSDDGATSYVDTSSNRYSTASTWLTQNAQGEPSLSSLCSYTSSTRSASHLLITPRDMALVAPNATGTTPNYQPDTSFICDDTNNDGKIDRVTISLHLAKYDSIGAQSASQQLRSAQVVDLPNIK